VIDINPVKRNLLVRGIIIPFRTANSSKIYKKVWTENGSPLLYYSVKAKELLQQKLGDEYVVELAMRYQSPSIEAGLKKLRELNLDSIKVIPMFPQYASASTGSVYQKIMSIVGKWQTVPNISFINSFHDNVGMIEVFADNAGKYNPDSFDHIIFSFHGLPQRQMIKADYSGKHCLKAENCCSQLTEVNKYCYSAQCHDTARLIAEKMKLQNGRYTVAFQSRLGKEPWIQPFTPDIIQEQAKKGAKRLLVFSPAFVADCLETIYEIGEEYNDEFKSLGGEHVQLVESLNDNPKWIEALAGIAKN
jgi:ferrochelatase